MSLFVNILKLFIGYFIGVDNNIDLSPFLVISPHIATKLICYALFWVIYDYFFFVGAFTILVMCFGLLFILR